MTEMGEYKEGRAEYFRNYYAKHREELNAHHKEWKRKYRAEHLAPAHIQTEEEHIEAETRRKERQQVASQKYYESHKERRRACGHKYREGDKQRLQARRKFVEQQKIGKACIKCGETNLDKLLFHHVDPTTKLFNVANCDHSEEVLLVEIAKCVILCKSCHLKHHHTGKKKPQRA